MKNIAEVPQIVGHNLVFPLRGLMETTIIELKSERRNDSSGRAPVASNVSLSML